jgi:hypothetical protein
MNCSLFQSLSKRKLVLFLCSTFLLSCSNKKPSSEKSNPDQSVLNPFASHFGETPSKQEYDGQLFRGNFDYPKQKPDPKIYAWTKSLKGNKLNLDNAQRYLDLIKEHVTEDMRIMVNAPKKWIDSDNKKNWYNMAWAGQHFKKTGWHGAEPISGTLTGQVLNPGVFSEYGFDGPMQNHVTVYYDKTAAYTLNKLWKELDPNGFYPNYTTEAAQFEQNAIVIKAAATDCSPNEWEVLKGTTQLPVYRPIGYGSKKTSKNVVQYLNWIQFDIIIKDTIAAPETGWVFATYIYDANSTGETTFDRLTLQGAMWGLDPEQMDPEKPLTETYLNPNAPAFGMANIGYGSRLSGPIDVAKVGGVKPDGTVKKVFVLNEKSGLKGGVTHDTYSASSCLSCHSTATYPYHTDFYPSPMQRLVYTDTIFHPKSTGWALYNTNRPGNEIIPAASGNNKAYMALDYDLFLLFALTNSGQLHHLHSNKKPLPPKGYNPEWLKKESHPLFY